MLQPVTFGVFRPTIKSIEYPVQELTVVPFIVPEDSIGYEVRQLKQSSVSPDWLK